jgi:hypothetical protein
VYYAKHREKILAHKAAHYTERRGERNAYLAARRKTDPAFRLLDNLRNRVREVLTRGGKSTHTLTLLGCTVPELMVHLQKQFKPGMAWNNYGTGWHIDHRVPCAAFNLLDPAQQRMCFHYTNLQPLWAGENLSKNDTVPDAPWLEGIRHD